MSETDSGDRGTIRISHETRAILQELLGDLHADLERRERIEAHFVTRLKWASYWSACWH